MRLSKLIFSIGLIFNSLFLYSQKVYNSETSIYKDGVQQIAYRENGLTLIGSAEIGAKYFGFGKEVVFGLYVWNEENESIDINPSKIKAYTEKKNKRKDIKVYTAKEYESKIHKAIIWFGPDNVEKVKVEQSSTTVNVKDKYGITQSSAEGNTVTEVKQYTGGRDKALQQATEYVDNNYLRRNTLSKGDKINGIVVAANPKNDNITFTVCINNDTFVFRFDLE